MEGEATEQPAPPTSKEETMKPRDQAPNRWHRQKFEQWCKQQSPRMSLDRDRTGYIEYATMYAWEGWRAALGIRNRKRKEKL